MSDSVTPEEIWMVVGGCGFLAVMIAVLLVHLHWAIGEAINCRGFERAVEIAFACVFWALATFDGIILVASIQFVWQQWYGGAP